MSSTIPCPACGSPNLPSRQKCVRCDASLISTRMEAPAKVTGAGGDDEAGMDKTVARGAVVLEGKWALGNLLGRGGMGEVYLAMDLQLGREVAVKMLAANVAHNPQIAERFLKEAKMMARLDHPNLVPVHSFGEHEGRPFLVMKRLQGAGLDARITEGPLPVGDALHIFRQLCAGLHFLHAQGIVHRDIKPSNVFVSPEGQVTLLDLGIARETDQRLTRTGMMIGTPQYMSPEQITSKSVDARSDQYAAAAVLYEMLAGEPLFRREGEFQILQAHLDDPPPDIRALRPELPERLHSVLLTALAKKADDRYPDVVSLLDEVEVALAEVGPTAGARSRFSAPTVASPSSRATPMPGAKPKSRPGTTPGPAKSFAPLPPMTGAALGDESIPPTTPSIPAGKRPRTPPPTAPLPPEELEPDTLKPNQVIAKKPSKIQPVSDASLMRDAGLTPQARSRLPLILGGALALAAILGAGFWLGKKESIQPLPPEDLDQPRGMTKLPQPKEDPAPKPDPVVQQEPPPEVKPDVKPDLKPDVKPDETLVAKGPDETPVEDKPETKRPPTAKRGELRVLAKVGGAMSWAWVEVDGVRHGSAPLTVKLAAGEHRLKITRDGYAPVERTLKVAAGETRVFNAELTK